MRVAVHGASGSGKTTLARTLARATGAPHLELDSLYHQPEWTPLDRESFSRRVSEFIAGEEWVVDGNYRDVRPLVWARASLIVIIDRPRWRTTWRVFRRTVSRGLRRTELWNGNRESIWRLFSRDPERNIVLWSWRKQLHYRRDVPGDAAREAPGATVVVVRSDADARRLITGLATPTR